MTVPIDGFTDPAFAPVREAFAINMNGGEEVGASVAVVLDGRLVVDLWGGYRDPARTRPWERDTIVCMKSVTKSVAAMCVLLLADRGRIELDAPVARYWPDFGQNGKAAITVRQALGQLASLPYLDALEEGDIWDLDKAVRAVELQAPEWPPGTTPCYHSFSAGPIYHGLVRHVDGRSLGRFLREEIAGPFGIDFHIGLTADEDRRRADYISTPGTPSYDAQKGISKSPMNRAWRPMPRDEDSNSVNYRFKEFASGAGHGNARSVARLYAGLASGGVIDGKRLFTPALVEDATREQWDGMEAMTSRHMRFCSGFMMSCPTFPIGGNRRNFGHPGLGGAVGFADPDRRMGVSYAPNRMAPISDQGPFAKRLFDAIYACLNSGVRPPAEIAAQGGE